jgi:hypothetical protein
MKNKQKLSVCKLTKRTFTSMLIGYIYTYYFIIYVHFCYTILGRFLTHKKYVHIIKLRYTCFVCSLRCFAVGMFKAWEILCSGCFIIWMSCTLRCFVAGTFCRWDILCGTLFIYFCIWDVLWLGHFVFRMLGLWKDIFAVETFCFGMF